MNNSDVLDSQVNSIKNDVIKKEEDNNIEDNSKRELTEERINFFRVINTFKSYGNHTKKHLMDKLQYFESLPTRHQKYLAEYKDSLNFQLKLADINDEVIKKIATDIDIFENDSLDEHEQELYKSETVDLRPEPHFHNKIHSILKQIVREWSADGEEERRTSFGPILKEIDTRFKGYKRDEVKVLVPGAGLGRLAFEVARRGYYCQGNEYSLFMLFTSNFILNKVLNTAQFTIYPYIHCSTNNYSVYDQVRSVKFPDINLCNINTDFSMVGGNFIEIYDKPNSFDCVATCFFIDTTHNVLDYVEKIYSILKPNGIWINVGPLLYHYADTHKESIEPSYDLLRNSIKSIGFEFLKEEIKQPMHYTQNSTSMLIYKYNSVFFVCEKKLYHEQ